MTHYQLVASNKRKSWIVILGFLLFITVTLYVFGRVAGMNLSSAGVALIVAGFVSFISYWFSDQLILTLSSAKPASRKEFFDFYTVTENVAASQQLPFPRLYVITDSAPNAFATGRDPQHAVVCATTGLLSKLDRGELEGVIAHELSHIKNYDMRLMSLVAIMVGFLALAADWFLRFSFLGGSRKNRSSDDNRIQMVFVIVGVLLALLSPLIAQLIQLAISRQREFLADASAVAMTKNPQGLITALQKISADKEPLEAANKATAHMYFENPLKDHSDAVGWFSNLFNTHPPVTERIKALQAITL